MKTEYYVTETCGITSMQERGKRIREIVQKLLSSEESGRESDYDGTGSDLLPSLGRGQGKDRSGRL